MILNKSLPKIKNHILEDYKKYSTFSLVHLEIKF